MREAPPTVQAIESIECPACSNNQVPVYRLARSGEWKLARCMLCRGTGQYPPLDLVLGTHPSANAFKRP